MPTAQSRHSSGSRQVRTVIRLPKHKRIPSVRTSPCISRKTVKKPILTSIWKPIPSLRLSKNIPTTSASRLKWIWNAPVPRKARKANTKPTRKTRPSTAWFRFGRKTKAKFPRKNTINFTANSFSPMTSLCTSSTKRQRAQPAIRRCCSFPKKRITTIIPRILKRDWHCIAAA